MRDEHPGLHYIPSSADEVVSGHGPYRMLPAKTYFTLPAGNDKFHSERGMPNVMTYEVSAGLIPKKASGLSRMNGVCMTTLFRGHREQLRSMKS